MQFPEELQRGWSGARRRGRGCLNEVQFPEELQLVLIMRPQGLVPASMKCSSRRNCSVVDGDDIGARVLASMKCSSRRNCSCPFSMARISWPLRRLRERSVRRTKANAHKTASLAPYGCNLNDSCPRALRRPLVAPERSRQATSGPSGVMVLVSPT